MAIDSGFFYCNNVSPADTKGPGCLTKGSLEVKLPTMQKDDQNAWTASRLAKAAGAMWRLRLGAVKLRCSVELLKKCTPLRREAQIERYVDTHR